MHCSAIEDTIFYPILDGDPGNPDDNPANWTLEIENQTFLPGVPVSVDLIDLSGITARYIAFAIDQNYGVTENLVGWGELQFSGTLVPEPTSPLLALLAALGLALLAKRRRRCAGPMRGDLECGDLSPLLGVLVAVDLFGRVPEFLFQGSPPVRKAAINRRTPKKARLSRRGLVPRAIPQPAGLVRHVAAGYI